VTRASHRRDPSPRVTEMETALLQMFDRSRDAVIIATTQSLGIVNVSASASTLLGFSREELLGFTMAELHPDEGPQLRAFAAEVTRQGSGWTDELRCVTRSGDRLPVEISASVAPFDGSPRLIALVRDISKRRQDEDAMRRAFDRLRHDLDAAFRMQKSLLPAVSSLMPGVRFAWELYPCRTLGGDLLNVVRVDDRHLAFYILDVSGHGVGAAMMSVAVHRLLLPIPGLPGGSLGSAANGADPIGPAVICRELNARFQLDTRMPQYFTLLYGLLDVPGRTLRFTSAGHCPPILARPGREPEELRAPDLPIGLVPGASYGETTVHLEPGARLYLYSDGLTEAANTTGGQFGCERLRKAIARGRRESLPSSLRSLLGAMRDWSDGTELADDVTLLGIELER